MQKTSLLALYVAFFAFSLFAFASPVGKDVVAVRASSSISAIHDTLASLKNDIDGHLSKLAGLSANADISSIIAEIITLVQAALAALKGIGAIAGGSQDEISAIAALLAGILNSLLTTLPVFAGVLLNLLNILTLDGVLNSLLGQLNLILPGILGLVAPLLVTVTGLLGILLPLVLGTLSLL